MEHKTKAVEVSFLKKTKWTGTATRMLTFPVGELADRCLNAWLDITVDILPRMNAGDSRISRFGFLFDTTRQEGRGR